MKKYFIVLVSCLVAIQIYLTYGSFENLLASNNPKQGDQADKIAQQETIIKLDPVLDREYNQAERFYVEKVMDAWTDFYPDQRPLKLVPEKVRGIYMSGRAFHDTTLFERLVELVDTTELNSLVIDFKDDDGFLTTDVNMSILKEVKPRIHKGKNSDLRQKIMLLNEKGIYPIARMVTFKDPSLAQAKPEWALQSKGGGLWKDRKGMVWVDPYNKDVWDYNINLAIEAVKLGFREIQFDYVRFPTDGNTKNIHYSYQENDMTKKENIYQFLKYAREKIRPYNAYISADVFGLTTSVSDDMGIGQQFEMVSGVVDYICPMVYPSHYGPYNYGLPNPNAAPYETIFRAMEDAKKKAEGTKVIIRPWLQDFSLGSPKYGPNEVRAQIKAVYDSGLEEWILWNAGNRYTKGALLEKNHS